MSSPDRRTILGFALLAGAAVTGCGFAPAYGTAGGATALQGTVRAADPTDKNAFDLVQRLEERLGPPQARRFDLTYGISTKAIAVGVTPDGTITRYNLSGAVTWTLTDTAGARVAGGTVDSFTSWSATGSTVAGLTAEQDANTRLMRILADQIVARLLALSASLPA